MTPSFLFGLGIVVYQILIPSLQLLHNIAKSLIDKISKGISKGICLEEALKESKCPPCYTEDMRNRQIFIWKLE